MTDEYEELVAQAERAVKSVRDAELRRVAFEKILDDLLGKPAAQAARRAGSAKRPSASQESPPRGRGSGQRRQGPQGHVESLIGDRFFAKPKTIAELKAELENRGHHIPLTSLSGPLQKLCQRKILRRQKSNTRGKKQTFVYSNW